MAQPGSGVRATAPRTTTGLVALVIGLAVLLVGILGFAAGRFTAPAAAASSPRPTAASSPATPPSTPTVSSSTKRGFSLDGRTLTGWTSTGSSITTTLPAGWQIGSFNGGNNSGQILNATADTIDYHTGYERAALDNCTQLILSVATDQNIVNLPGHTWAGKTATAVRVLVHSDERKMSVDLTYICVDTSTGHSDLLRLLGAPETNDAVMAAATSLLDAWSWS